MKKIAALYRRRRKLDSAAEILRTVTEMERRLFGPNSIAVATSIYELAEIYADLQLYDQARPLYEEAVTIWQTVHSQNPSDQMFYADALIRVQERSEKDAHDKDNHEREAA